MQAQGGNPQVLDKFELLPNATGVREITSPRAGYVSAIDAEDIGRASTMIGAGRDRKDDAIDPAVGVILEATPRRTICCLRWSTTTSIGAMSSASTAAASSGGE